MVVICISCKALIRVTHGLGTIFSVCTVCHNELLERIPVAGRVVELTPKDTWTHLDEWVDLGGEG